jgi:hypothetical protein
VPSSTVSDKTTGQLWADAILKERAAAHAAGRQYLKSHLAAKLDALLAEFLVRYPYPPEAPRPPVKSKRKRSVEGTNIPPSPEEVTLYCQSKGYSITGEEFCDFYGSKGWKVGNVLMKNWHCAVNTWARREPSRMAKPTTPEKPKDYTSI